MIAVIRTFSDLSFHSFDHPFVCLYNDILLFHYRLHGNPINDMGVHAILDAIISTKDTAITNLDLGDCQMGDAGATDIARLLLNNATITDLTISGNSIGLSGWRIISSALEQNTTLKSLSLDFSNIRDDEAVILADGIKENKGLRSLDLEGNKIGDEGGRSLLEAIKINTTLVDLTLMPMNEISKDIHDEIKAVLDGRSKTPSRVSSANGSIRSTTKDENDAEKPSTETAQQETNKTTQPEENTTQDAIQDAASKSEENTKQVNIEDDVDMVQTKEGSSQEVTTDDPKENGVVPHSEETKEQVKSSQNDEIDPTMYLQ